MPIKRVKRALPFRFPSLHVTRSSMPINANLLKGAFFSLMYGADKIPDSWFEKVPGGYYREKKRVENERNKQRRRARHYSDVVHGRDDDDGYLSDDYEARKGRNRHQSDFDDDDDEYHGKDRSRRNRGKSVGASRGNLDGSRSEDPPLRPYNPAEYGPVGVGEREEYYNGRHQGTGGDGTRYVPVSWLT